MVDSATPHAARLEQVSKRLGDTLALDAVDLEIPRRGGTAIVGESGSGKSTVLAHLIGLESPDSGRVTVLDQPVTTESRLRLRRRLGYAVQETGLFPHLTVRDNIALPARVNPVDSLDVPARVERLCALTSLDEGLLERYPLALSGGQRQRAGLCRAMLLAPELLLLDEPFSGLDVMTRRDLYRHFNALLRDEDTAFVLVTHDLNEARQLCERLVVLKNGRVVASGETIELMTNPPDGYVADLIDAHRLHDAND